MPGARPGVNGVAFVAGTVKFTVLSIGPLNVERFRLAKTSPEDGEDVAPPDSGALSLKTE